MISEWGDDIMQSDPCAERITVICPFIYSHAPIRIGGIDFQVLRRDQVYDDDLLNAASRKMRIFRKTKELPVDSSLVVVLDGQQSANAFRTAVLCLMYMELIRSSHTNDDCFADHFEYDQVWHERDDSSITLFERGRWLVGTVDSLVRNLPGGLQPRCIRAFDEIESEQANQLYGLMSSNQRVHSAIRWYCKSFRWCMDREDRLISIITAFEALMEITRSEKRKYNNSIKDPIGYQLMERLIDHPDLHHWFVAAYTARNALMHEGYSESEAFTYHDSANNAPIQSHEGIARVVFDFLIRALSDQAPPTSDLAVSLMNLVKSDVIIGAVTSNRRNLCEAIDLLCLPTPSVSQLLEACAKLSRINKIDLSLTSEQCESYGLDLQRIADGLPNEHDMVLRSTVASSLRHACHHLDYFRQILRTHSG